MWRYERITFTNYQQRVTWVSQRIFTITLRNAWDNLGGVESVTVLKKTASKEFEKMQTTYCETLVIFESILWL